MYHDKTNSPLIVYLFELKKKGKKNDIDSQKQRIISLHEQVVLASVTHIYSSLDSKEGHCIV
jgi:hypothetical protein